LESALPVSCAPHVGLGPASTVTDVLPKHFAGVGSERWKWPALEGNPLGLDWLAVDYSPTAAPVPDGTDVALSVSLVAAP
jgi:hypothetical protein